MGYVTCRHGQQPNFIPRSCRVEEKNRQLEAVFQLSVHAQIHKVNKCLKCDLKKNHNLEVLSPDLHLQQAS